MIESSSVYKQERHFVRVHTGPRTFIIEVEKEDDADFLRRAIECYANFDNVRAHMSYAIHKLEEVEPKRG
jgi:hypothetical protein